MNLFIPIRTLLIGILLTLLGTLLLACGGGGGSNTSTDEDSSQPQSQEFIISGRA